MKGSPQSSVEQLILCLQDCTTIVISFDVAAISLMIAKNNHFIFSTSGETISIDYCPLPSIDIMIIPYSTPYIPNTNGLLKTQWTMLLAADWSVHACMYLA